MAKQNNFLTYLMLIFGMAIFGSATPVSKLVTESFNPWVGTGFRLVLAMVLLLPILIVQRQHFQKLKKKDYLVLSGIAIIGVIGFTATLIYGMRFISGVKGSIIMSTTPAITALGSFIFFHDKFGWRKITAIALAVAGVLLLNVAGESEGSGGNQVWLGMLMVFAAVCCEASYTLMGKKATQDVPSLFVAAFTGVLAAVLFLPVLLWQLQDFSFAKADTDSLIALGWWGLGAMGLGSITWYGGVARVKGSIAAGFMGVMPVSALVLSYVLLGEKFQWIHMAGFALVFTGVLLIIWSHRRMMKQQNDK
ncbi:MAG: DMT family transporter [Cyclobacteriaceae bacterium]